jgi:outer membrane protein assembly factor BamE (lipoprotein component of BamABCDE complex)
MKRLASLLVVCSVLITAGCSFKATSGNPIGTKQTETIRKGLTTRQEVVNLFGSPQLITRLEGKRERHTYVFQDQDVGVTHLIILPITLVNVSGKVRSLIVTYDENGVVTTHEFVAGVQMPVRSAPVTPGLNALF